MSSVQSECSTKEEARCKDKDTENKPTEHEADDETDQNDTQNQSDPYPEKNARGEEIGRIIPVGTEEEKDIYTELKKTVVAGSLSLSDDTKYQGRTSVLMDGHEDLTPEGKRVLNSPRKAIGNSSLTSRIIKDGGSLTQLLSGTPGSHSNVTVTFLNAQIQGLRDELQSVTQKSVEKEETVIQLERKLKEIEQDRNSLLKDISNKQRLIEKYQRISDDNRSRAGKLEIQCASLRKEVEILRQGQKQTASSTGTLETRLGRALEEIEKLKADLFISEKSAKETSEIDKRRIVELAEENRHLGKQRRELLTAFKKQMKLIDNLKRQKMHLEAAKALQFSEEEFMRALDWGPSN